MSNVKNLVVNLLCESLSECVAERVASYIIDDVIDALDMHGIEEDVEEIEDEVLKACISDAMTLLLNQYSDFLADNE